MGCTFQLLENSKGQKGGGDRSWMVSPVIDWAADHQLDLLRWWREGAAGFAFLDIKKKIKKNKIFFKIKKYCWIQLFHLVFL